MALLTFTDAVEGVTIYVSDRHVVAVRPWGDQDGSQIVVESTSDGTRMFAVTMPPQEVKKAINASLTMSS